MKKIISLLLVLVALDVNATDYTITIYTKYGQAIEAKILDEITPSMIQEFNDSCIIRFPCAVFLNNSTRTYNCHSYAWNISDGGTTICWINQFTSSGQPNIAKYWTNDYYSETTEANAIKVFYYLSDHSAIVSPTVPGMYESKWGQGALMRHAPGYGPYPNMNYRRYYKPYVHGVLLCSNGTGTIGVNVSSTYNPLASSVPNIATTFIWSIEDSKEGDAIEEGYAVINYQSGYVANITFTRPGNYDMTLRCYTQNNILVADYSFQALVI